jgi:hypothetical protein
MVDVEDIVDEGGAVFYYKYGTCTLHREDGPAIEYPNGDKYWYFNGKEVDCCCQEEFEQFMKLKAFW